MVCKKCGSQLDDNAKFCGVCGSSLELENVSANNVFDVETDNSAVSEPVQPIQNNVGVSEPVQPIQNNVGVSEPVQPVQNDLGNVNPVQVDNSNMNDNSVSYEIKSGKSGKKAVGIIIFLLIVIGLLGGGYYYLTNKKAIVKKLINSVYDKIDGLMYESDFDYKKDSILVNGDLTFNTNYSELSDLDGEKLNYTFGLDYPNKKFELGASLEEKGSKIIEGTLFGANDLGYIIVKDCFDGIIKGGDLSFDDIFKSMNITSVDYDIDDIKYVTKAYKDILIKSLDMKDFKKSKDTIDVNGKSQKVTKLTYELDSVKAQKLIVKMSEETLKDSKLLNIISKMSGVSVDELKQSLESVKSMDLSTAASSGSVKFDIYTKGFMNDFVGMDITTVGVIKIRKYDNICSINLSVGTQGVEILVKEIDSNSYEISFEANVTGQKINAVIGISSKKESDKSYTGSVSFNANIDGQTFGIKSNYTATIGGKVADYDVSNAKAMDDLTEQELSVFEEKLMSKFTGSNIYKFYESYLSSMRYSTYNDYNSIYDDYDFDSIYDSYDFDSMNSLDYNMGL